MSSSLLWEDLVNGCSKQGAPWCKNDLGVIGHGSWNELREGEGGGELGRGQGQEGSCGLSHGGRTSPVGQGAIWKGF